MRYVRLPPFVDSGQEEEIVANQLARSRKASLARRGAEFAQAVTALDRGGIRHERERWIATTDPRVFAFTGRHHGEEPTREGGLRLWAAYELDADGRPVTLLKIVAHYVGDAREFEDHMADALDRFKRGTRFP